MLKEIIFKFSRFLFVGFQLSVVATDNGFPALSGRVTVTVFVTRNRNGPVFDQDQYATTTEESRAIDSPIITVRAVDADNDAVKYRLLVSVPASLYFRINENTGVIYIDSSLQVSSIETFVLNVEAYDVPNQAVSSRSDLTQVTISVTRNPNSPVFTQSFYNTTISEYESVQSLILPVSATDLDSRNTPSGIIRYSVRSISYTPPNGFSQFVISESAGGIYLSQPLIRDGVPNRITITVEARDSALNSKTATATVEVNIIRNLNEPLFTNSIYRSEVYDASAVGTSLFVVTAIDRDRDVPLNRDTPNAEFDYLVDPDYPVADNYFGITKDGIVYVRKSLTSADGRSQFKFWIVALDRSWKPKSSRSEVIVNVTYVVTQPRVVGFDQPLYR